MSRLLISGLEVFVQPFLDANSYYQVGNAYHCSTDVFAALQKEMSRRNDNIAMPLLSKEQAIAMLLPPEFPAYAMDTEAGILIVADWWEEQGVGLIADRLRAYVAKRREGQQPVFPHEIDRHWEQPSAVESAAIIAALEDRQRVMFEQQAEHFETMLWTTLAQRRRDFLNEVKLEPESKK